MADLIEELLEALEPYDVAIASFTKLRTWLTSQEGDEYAETRLQAERTLKAFIGDRTRALRDTYGHDHADKQLGSLIGLSACLIMGGKLTSNPLTDMIIVYAAHLSALTSYGESPWHNVSKVILAAQVRTTEKELARSRR
jgi:hypothetical protein